MKYLLSLLLGIAAGAVLFFVGMLYNPFLQKQALSPLAVTDARTLSLSYSPVADESIAYTNDGESHTQPHPVKIQQLWEQPIRQSYALATVLRDGRQRVAGIGIKLSSASESTRMLSGELLANSVWFIHLPGQGSFFIEQTENYWNYFRDVVAPAYRSGADTLGRYLARQHDFWARFAGHVENHRRYGCIRGKKYARRRITDHQGLASRWWRTLRGRAVAH